MMDSLDRIDSAVSIGTHETIKEAWEQLKRDLGPLLRLGNEVTAASDYADSADWKDAFGRLTNLARRAMYPFKETE
jgi:mRNA-degrading endonuclease HigB of HigAB toxin-antitoxin module